MKQKLKRCPCGQMPDKISVIENGKWVYATPDCCNEWYIEFRSDWESDPDKLQALANEAWNAQPRDMSKRAAYFGMVAGVLLMWAYAKIMGGVTTEFLAMLIGVGIAVGFDIFSGRSSQVLIKKSNQEGEK